jgi:hypothetical protein
MSTFATAASRFAHLGRPAPSVKAETEEEKKKREEDEAAAKKKAEEDKKKEEDEAAAKKKAEEDKKKEDAKKKGDGDDESDREDDEEPEARAARARERGRIAAILSSEAGNANPIAAAHIATGTSIPRSQAIEMVHAMGPAAEPAPRGDPLRERMASTPRPDIGAGEERPAANLAQMIVVADKKARGET